MCSRFNWKRFGFWHAKTDVDKIIKKGQGSEWFAIFHALSRILVGYVFVGARCGWGWTKSIWTGHEKEEKRACVYICVCVSECDGPALFLGCVAQSVPSSVCPFPSYSASPPFSPPPPPPFILLCKHTKQPIGRLREELAFALEKDWVVPSHPSICRSSRAAFCLRPDAHRRTNWGKKWSPWVSTSSINFSSFPISNWCNLHLFCLFFYFCRCSGRRARGALHS